MSWEKDWLAVKILCRKSANQQRATLAHLTASQGVPSVPIDACHIPHMPHSRAAGLGGTGWCQHVPATCVLLLGTSQKRP